MEGVPLLRIENLALALSGADRFLVREVSLEVRRAEIFGLVGESGCGKTLTGLASLGLFPPGVEPRGGRVLLEDTDILSLPEGERRLLRGRRVAMIFQEPLTALNPVFTVGYQVEEVLRLHRGLSGAEARRAAARLFSEVGLPDPEARLRNYPHELSGGMRQRVMIAMALAGDPDLLVADEPTTALDVTVQAQILELFLELRERRGLAIFFISHDLAIIREVADRVAVMYAGEVVEMARREELFENPLHPYTRALLEAFPRLGTKKLKGLAGQVPPPGRWPPGCRFAPRCPERLPECEKTHPELKNPAGNRWVRCLRR